MFYNCDLIHNITLIPNSFYCLYFIYFGFWVILDFADLNGLYNISIFTEYKGHLL